MAKPKSVTKPPKKSADKTKKGGNRKGIEPVNPPPVAAPEPERDAVGRLPVEDGTAASLGAPPPAAQERPGAPSDPAFDSKPEKDQIDAALSKAAPAVDASPAPGAAPAVKEFVTTPMEPFEQPFERVMHIPFSRNELADKAERLGKLKLELLELEVEKKAENDRLKEEIDVVEKQMDAVLKEINAKTHEAKVACIKRVDYETGTLTIFIRDTLEIIEKRQLSLKEQQVEMKFRDDVAMKNMQKNTEKKGKGEVVEGPWGKKPGEEAPANAETLASNGPDNGTDIVDKPAGLSAQDVCQRIVDEVPGVIECSMFENITDEIDEDKRPPKSIEVVAVGGDDVDLANKILELLGLMEPRPVLTFGNKTITVAAGEVSFTRPDAVQEGLGLNPAGEQAVPTPDAGEALQDGLKAKEGGAD